MTERSRGHDRAQAPSTAELIDRLSRFDGPPEAFLVNLLAVQCYIAAAEGGAILRLLSQGGEAPPAPPAEAAPAGPKVEVLAVYPQLAQGATAPVWLAKIAENAPQVGQSGITAVLPVAEENDLYGAPARRYLIIVPIRGGSSVRGVTGFLVQTADAATLSICRERIELTVSLLSLYEMRLTLQRRQLDLSRLKLVMEVLSAVNEHDRFAGGAMGLCNELAARMQCERVSLGFLKGRYVQMKAQNHTEKFSRKMKLIQDIESAMEECLDQDLEIPYPASPQATFVCRAHKELSTRHGPSAVLSLPIRRGRDVQAVITLERPADKPFTIEEVESLRLLCDLAAARLINLFEHDRWVGARAAMRTRKVLSLALGPKHTWVKLLCLGIAALIIFVTFFKGDYEAASPFTLEAINQRTISAPFDGQLVDIQVEPSDKIIPAGALLAKIDVQELQDKLIQSNTEMAKALADRENARKEATEDSSKQINVLEADARVRGLEANIKFLEAQIAKAEIRAPIAGKVTQGDWMRMERPPVKKGDAIFEIAQTDQLRAVLEISEEDIGEVQKGAHGQLACTAYPGVRVGFTVDTIIPVAEVVEQKNVFKVRVTLDSAEVKEAGADAWMRPNMKGQSRVYLGKKPYAELWTRKLVNWVRMKLWI